MTWVLVIAGAWLAVAALLAVVVGRGIRLADQRATSPAGDAPNFTVDDVSSDGAIAPAFEDSRPTADATAEQAMPVVPTSRPPVIGPSVTRSQRAPAPHQAEQA